MLLVNKINEKNFFFGLLIIRLNSSFFTMSNYTPTSVISEHMGPMSKAKSEPFIMLQMGPRKSGKSYFNKEFIKAVIKDYDEVHFLNCSINLNDDYDEFRKTKYRDKCVFHEEITPDTLEEIIRAAEECKEEYMQFKRGEEIVFRNVGGDKVKYYGMFNDVDAPANYYLPTEFATNLKPITREKCNRKRKQGVEQVRILIVCDDCVDAGVFRYLSTIDRVAMRGRHALVSLIGATQRITTISVNVRSNTDFILLFTPSDMQEFESLMDKFIPKNHRKLIRPRLEAIFDKRFQFLVCDSTDHRLNNKFKECNTDMWLQDKWIEIDLRDYLAPNATYNSEALVPEYNFNHDNGEREPVESQPTATPKMKKKRMTKKSIRQFVEKRRKGSSTKATRP